MKQKVIKVGNSYAVTIPKSFVKEVGLEYGQELNVEADTTKKALSIALPGEGNTVSSEVTPEFVEWLQAFNKKYKHVLTELSKK